jgi:hypothetical protein
MRKVGMAGDRSKAEVDCEIDRALARGRRRANGRKGGCSRRVAGASGGF